MASPPDADFLEFLGPWQTGDDTKWIDPLQADDPSALELEDRTSEIPSRDVRDRQGMSRINPNPSSQDPADAPPRSREGAKP